MQPTPLALVPQPQVLVQGDGTLLITGERDVDETLDRFLPPEAYLLDVGDDGVKIRGGDDAGLFYAKQTLLQLLPAGRRTLEGPPTPLPHVHIEDAPAFPWRGFMLDVARHFFPASFVLKVIDQLAAHKLNVLHLHLTDDQGWRIPIPGYPRLTEVGGWRSETVVGFDHEGEDIDFTGVPHGGAYTRRELEKIVAYAAERHVEVVPEVDMPGHVTAAIAAYPVLGSGEAADVWTRWGINTRILNLENSTLDFVRVVLAEVASIFPSPHVHAGGDEVPKKEWRVSSAAQAKLTELGLGTEEKLQGWFTAEVAQMLRGHGRRIVAWDEVIDGDAPEDALVMAWRSTAHGVNAVLAGYDTIMSPSEFLYFDHAQSRETTEPVTFPHSSVPLRRVFEFEPVPRMLRDAPVGNGANGRVVGAQAHLWTEYVPTVEHAEYMMFPRLCAFAEAVWREPLEPSEDRDFAAFVARLTPHLDRLEAAGIRFRPLDPSDEPTRTVSAAA